MRATVRNINMEIEVRKMGVDEMPDDGVTYYVDDDSYCIYSEDELAVVTPEQEDE